jgi:chorismate mutase/prephenate dehydratase
MDVSGHRQDKTLAGALKSLEEHAIFVKILGSYPRMK